MIPSLSTYMAALAALTSMAYSSPQGSNVLSTVTTAAVPLATAGAASNSGSAVACNNSPDLCSRSYSNITHMGAHDSSFLRDASTQNSIAGNQYFNATVALDAGIRLLQVQVHDLGGVIEMCHTTCDLLDAGPLQNWLAHINYWLDNNPNEVVTLLIVNSDGNSAAEFGAAFKASGIAKHGFAPNGEGWPTLQSMISAGTRLVTFIASVEATAAYPYLLPEFEYVFETAYEITSLAGFNCSIDRPSKYETSESALAAGLLPLMNHFAYKSLGGNIMIPNVDDIATTNSPSTSTTGALGLHAQTCLSQWGFKPTFVLVDFFSEGPSIRTADVMNGVADPVGRKNDSTASATDANAPGNAARRGHGDASGMVTGALIAFIAAALVLT